MKRYRGVIIFANAGTKRYTGWYYNEMQAERTAQQEFEMAERTASGPNFRPTRIQIEESE